MYPNSGVSSVFSLLHYFQIYSQYPDYCNQIYPSIAQSWVKSRISGVNIQPEVLERSFLSLQELQTIQEKNQTLIDYTKSMFNIIKNELLSYEYTMHLFDQNGILIFTETTIPKYSPTLSPAKGTIWNEELVGTHTGKIISTNQIACQMFKQEADQLIGRNIIEFLSIESRLIDQIKRGHKVDMEESIGIGRNKQPFHISVHPIINEYTDKIDAAILKINYTREKSTPNSKTGFATRFNFENIIGESKEFSRAIDLAKTYANSPENILIIGESGTGKELFAQAIHNIYSPNGPFMAVNCAAMPRNLIESELFGYEGGSFTGADRSGRPGKIELAEGGTLF